LIERSYRRGVSKARADAWRHLPPFDRLHEEIVGRSTPDADPAPCPDDIPIYVQVKGTHVTVRMNVAGEPIMRLQFRWRESNQEWQLFARDGSRWVADGLPRPSVSRLLETLIEGTLRSNSTFRKVAGRARARPPLP
jgi:hypothetical protein